MAKPRGKSRSRAIMRLVIVAGIALYVLTSLYESRKQRALAESIARRLRHGDDHAAQVGGSHAHTGDHGGMFNGMHRPHAHRARSGSVGTGHASDDASDADPASRHPSDERGERPVRPAARGGSASVPAGWMDAAPRGSANACAAPRRPTLLPLRRRSPWRRSTRSTTSSSSPSPRGATTCAH